jgi:hypothetical protein
MNNSQDCFHFLSLFIFEVEIVFLGSLNKRVKSKINPEMKTRMKKWARYREKIAATPSTKFSPRKHLELETSSEDAAIVAQTAKSSGAISFASVGGKSIKHSTLYVAYRRKNFAFTISKVILLLLAIAGFIVLYFKWVVQ